MLFKGRQRASLDEHYAPGLARCGRETRGRPRDDDRSSCINALFWSWLRLRTRHLQAGKDKLYNYIKERRYFTA